MVFNGKIPFHVAARLTPRLWVHHLPLVATIRHYSRLFAIIRTIRDYSYYSYYSPFGTIRYSLFGFSRHPKMGWKKMMRYAGEKSTRDNQVGYFIECKDLLHWSNVSFSVNIIFLKTYVILKCKHANVFVNFFNTV